MDEPNSDAPPRDSDQLLRRLVDCALERVFSVPREQAIGMPLATIFTPIDEQSGLADLEQSIAHADATSQDDRWHIRANGSRFWASGALIASV